MECDDGRNTENRDCFNSDVLLHHKRYAPFSTLRLGSSEIEQVAADRAPTESAGISASFQAWPTKAADIRVLPGYCIGLLLLILLHGYILLTSSTSTFYGYPCSPLLRHHRQDT